MRKEKFELGNYYHIYNRSSGKRPVFINLQDNARALFLIAYLQSPVRVYNIGSYVRRFTKYSVFSKNEKLNQEVMASRTVRLVAFCLMPTHFHLIVHMLIEGGISKYLQRVQEGYTKYFNTKYKTSGHLFQGPFRAVHIESNEHMLYASAYAHRNPRELPEWKDKEHLYPWSSYQDYVGTNRWGGLLEQEVIMSQFQNAPSLPASYKSFVESSGAKMENYQILGI